MSGETFKVHTQKTFQFRKGWGVAVVPIFEGETEDGYSDRISEIEIFVVAIASEKVTVSGGIPRVKPTDSQIWFPVENFLDVPDLWEDDSHDLRDRWFATENEANNHANSVREQWDNPAPWQSFVVM